MDKSQAYNAFWNSFSWKAYDETTVPEDLTTPYITYEFQEGFIGDTLPLTVSLWMRSTSWAEIEQKAMQIGNVISLGGKVVEYDGGKLWIRRGTPFAQRMADPDDRSIRRIILNINAEFISA